MAAPVLKGRVGSKPPALEWDFHDVDLGRVMHIRCRNNPEFSLTYNLDLGLVSGGQLPEDLFEPGAYEAGSGRPFTVRKLGTAIRIDHLGCPAFWLEITM